MSRAAGRLPPEAVAALQRAAQTPVDNGDPLARQKAIEQATKRIKQQYPHLFLKDEHYED